MGMSLLREQRAKMLASNARATLEDASRFFPAATPTSLYCYYRSFGWVLVGARVEHYSGIW